jgi:hypothetical protein
MVKIIFKPNFFDIFSKKEQSAAARTNSHGQAHIATACGVPLLQLGLAISDKKLFHGRRNRRNNWFVPAEFRLFRGTGNSRNSILNRSAEEKNARNSVQWNKIRSKRSEFPEFHSEPFRGRENNSEFRSVEQKYKQTLGILFRIIPRKRQQLGIPFRSMSPTKTCCQFCLLGQDFL